MGTELGVHIKDLVLVWLDWMQADTIARDESLPINERYFAALDCEILINERYKIMEKIDDIFES
jgi:hypothetical protein